MNAALDRETGEFVWRNERPTKPNYPSPVIFEVAGKPQLLYTGCDLVTSLNPSTGKTNWEIEGATTECVTTTVTDGTHVFTSGGYPTNHVSAVKADGSGEVVWQNKVRVYVPSMIAHEGYLYGVTDAGVAYCWESATGKKIWNGRLGGTFSSSPTMAEGRIYVTNESGMTFVYAATPEKFELLAKNKLGDHVMATPAFAGNQLIYRVAMRQSDSRQEWLYCLREASK